jgi:hypothetical protein
MVVERDILKSPFLRFNFFGLFETLIKKWKPPIKSLNHGAFEVKGKPFS